MALQIEDGKGTGYRAQVDSNNRIKTEAINTTNQVKATRDGDSYNINTGIINLTTNAEHGLLYIKNNETRNLNIQALALGTGTGTLSDSIEIRAIRNPTLGTLITGATDADMIINRNFGSSQQLVADVYKGVDGDTVTDGTLTALLFQTAGSRLFAEIDIILQPGQSIAFTVNPNVSAGSIDIYLANIVYLEST